MLKKFARSKIQIYHKQAHKKYQLVLNLLSYSAKKVYVRPSYNLRMLMAIWHVKGKRLIEDGVLLPLPQDV